MFRTIQILWCMIIMLSSLPVIAQTAADTMLQVRLGEVEVRDKIRWTDDTARYYFNQMRYNVQTILPYLHTATRNFTEIDAYLSNPALSKREKRQLVRSREEELSSRFGDDLRQLNETQGVLLIKLIARQTGLNIYSILKEFRNPLTAIKWQAWARLNGFNLNKTYHPQEEILLEQVMQSLGYDLPSYRPETAAEHAAGK